jgi:putative two-component system response regulator
MVTAQLPDSKILVIDDHIQNIQLSVSVLEWAGYHDICTVLDPMTAIAAFRDFNPDLVILDLHMPGLDGYQVLEQLREFCSIQSYVPILVFTADGTSEARKKALELGASDFLTKPGDATEILLRVQNFLRQRHMQLELEQHNHRLEQRIFERTEELYTSRQETLDCLAAACDYRDDQTGNHTKRVGELSAAIAATMGVNPTMVELIRHAAPLHDIGKIGVSDNVLLKPGKLEPHEFEQIKLHTFIGAEILARAESPILVLAREIALYHHEKWDGTGYLERLKGEDIPLSARIVAVADAFDAMTSDRPYAPARSRNEAVKEIKKCSGTHFDPKVVEVFISVVEMGGFDRRLSA